MTFRRFMPLFGTAWLVLFAAPICRSRPSAALVAIPQALEASSPLVTQAVTMLCGKGGVSRGKNGGVNGCVGCPDGTDFAGDGTDTWGLYGVTEGHFTSLQADNLILSGSGCDSHAQNWGGSFVFTVQSGQPKLMKYDKGLITSQCAKLSFATGQDFLVCRSGWSGQGEAYDNVMVSKFDATGKDSTQDLLRTDDQTGNCSGSDSTVIQQSGITSFNFSPQNSGVVTGMTVTVTYGTPTCAQYAAAFKAKTVPANVKTYQVQFTFDGKQFKVAPKSQALVDAHFTPGN
jgi:hypothetical protein